MPTRAIGIIIATVAAGVAGLASISLAQPQSARPETAQPRSEPARIDRAQIDRWTDDDLRFFLHGTISTEVIPENVLVAFRSTYPNLFPGKDFSAFGLVDDPAGDLPVGLSRREVPHLGGLACIGINCASCHVADVAPAGGGAPARVLGVTAHFDPEAFFGAVVVAMFQTADCDNMSRFLSNYLPACDPNCPPATRTRLDKSLTEQKAALATAMGEELKSLATAPPGALLDLDAGSLTLTRAYVEDNRDLATMARSLLRLFYNMRVALHVPHTPPAKAPPLSGPGRNNAFGLLSVVLFNEPTPYGPAKFGVAWNLEQRKWVHWDGNTRAPIIRNLAASLGLGAPLIGNKGLVDFAAVQRQTDLTEKIRAPRYPWKIDSALAQRGEALFAQHCATCHTRGADGQDRLVALDEVRTDANRAKIVTEHQAELYNGFFARVQVDGYKPLPEPPVRSTGRYVAVDLAGVWARSPYLHNGSVRTMMQLLTPAASREKSFQRGARSYDAASMGYTDGGPYKFDTAADGNSNAGHEYGTGLSEAEKRALIEYLKTL